MAALSYDNIYTRIRDRRLLATDSTTLPDSDLELAAQDVAADLFDRYPCLGTEASLATSAVETRALEQAIAAKVSALLAEGANGQALLSSRRIKQGTVNIEQGGGAQEAAETIKGFWSVYSSSLRSITCIGDGGRVIFAVAGTRTEPLSVVNDAYQSQDDDEGAT